LIAGWFGFKEEPLFDVKESQEREAVKVEF